MRILHILDHSIPLHSGYTFRTLSILKEQRALGWETFHLTSPKHLGGEKDEEEVDGWRFYRTLHEQSRLPVMKEIALMNALTHRLMEVAQRLKPDILHAHSPVLNAIPALRVGRRLGLPVVYEVRAFWEDAAVDHGTTQEGSIRYRLTRGLETYALKRANAVTTICEGLRQDIVARGLSADKVTVIPNAVNVDTFSMSTGDSGTHALRQKLGLQNKRVIGFIGSFYAYEGLSLLLRAMPLIASEIPDIAVLLVGGGPQEAELKQLTTTLGLSDKVHFIGRVPHETVPHYYDLIDILAYPRLSMRLTDLVTPLKPLEAMAQGRLLVASDVGGHKELIEHNRTGVLFKAGNAADLAAAAIKLINNKNQWDMLKINARNFVEQERNWQKSVSHYQSVYAKLVR